MRGHNSEHSDSLPVIDVSAMKHIAYVFDALIYFLRSGNQNVVEESGVESRASSADDAFAQVMPCPFFSGVLRVPTDDPTKDWLQLDAVSSWYGDGMATY